MTLGRYITDFVEDKEMGTWEGNRRSWLWGANRWRL